MIRKIALFGALAPVAVLTFAPSGQSRPTKPPTEAAPPAAPATPLASLVRASNAMGFARLRASKGDTAFSPAGVTHALAPVAPGTQGYTRAELLRGFGLPEDDDQVASALTEYLGDANKDEEVFSSHTGFLLNGDFPPTARFKSALTALPACELLTTEATPGYFFGLFGGSDGFRSGEEAIAAWLKKHSRMSLSLDEARALMPHKIAKDDTWVFTAINANYFKGRWKIRFDKERTWQEDFFSEAAPGKVAMMNETSTEFIAGDMDWLPGYGADKPKHPMPTAEGPISWRTQLEYEESLNAWPRHQYLRMRFDDGKRSMIILLPRWDRQSGQSPDDALAALEKQLTGDALSNTLERIRTDGVPANVQVKLPKFTLRAQHKLLSRESGAPQGTAPFTMQALTNPLISDFSPMSAAVAGEWIKGKNVVLGEVTQICEVEVNEDGAKAASVTTAHGISVGCCAMGFEQTAYEFTADHPFLFIIQDDKTGAALFVGRVTQPVANAAQ